MLKIVLKNLRAVRAPPGTLLGSSLALPQTPLLPLPKNPTPLLAFGLDFRPSPSSLHFPPPMHRGLDKNTGSAHFRSQRMHQNARSCIKNIPIKFRWSRPPYPRSRGDICSHPPPSPPARCWCPSASSRLATSLFYTNL